MFLKTLFLCFLLLELGASSNDEFTFNGFQSANLSMDGTATITPEGLLRLTNTTKLLKGHAFYPAPISFKRSPADKALSFSTTFVFGIISEKLELSGHGIVHGLFPSKDLSGASWGQYMGILSASNDGDASNHIVAVELDTILNPELRDINPNHVGIDINSMRSNTSYPAGYFTDTNGGEFRNLTLVSGEPMQVWAEYDGRKMQLNVTLAPMGLAKPSTPLLCAAIDLSAIILDQMYVGFSSSTDPFPTSHYILGWSFKVNGQAQALDLHSLPSLPHITSRKLVNSWRLWLSLASIVFVLGAVAVVLGIVRRRIKFSELLEDWETEYGPQRCSFKDLYEATNGFRDKELLGAGGFGKVYRGVLPTSKAEIAVKRVSHDSRQGMKEFVAEIVSIGRLRHRNLVQLLGYCRRKGELLLVYDFMPNGSLDRWLFDNREGAANLNWNQRFRIIKGVASGLLYLHEGWEQVVVHRDVKASNVLLDGELNGRLGDFGLARLYDHGGASHTTHVVGTMGYIAPELTRGSKASTVTDVFAFGVFLLEVACGRRPIEPNASEEEVVLVDVVLACWTRGAILEAADAKLGEYVREETELVLKLGLLCCDPLPAARPSMRLVTQMLDGDVPLPVFTSNYLNPSAVALLQNEAMGGFTPSSYPSFSMSASLLSGGR